MPVEKSPESVAGTVSSAIAALRHKLSKFESEEGRLKGLRDFRPRPTDLFVVTSPKAGTTWMQQIVHQLRTSSEGGISEEFEEISSIIPWLETAHDLGQNLDHSMQDEHGLHPRAFKTHAWYPHTPKGGRYIYVIREPLDCVVSFFKMFEGWFFDPGELSLEEFARAFWLLRGEPAVDDWMTNAGIWHHLLSWWPHRHDDNVLFVFYEDMKEDLRREVLRVAKFIGAPAADAVIDKVCHRSSFAYMKEHDRLFDDHVGKLVWNDAMGLPKEKGTQLSKLSDGKSSGKVQLPPALHDDILARWRDTVGTATGFKTYEELRKAFHAELRSSEGIGASKRARCDDGPPQPAAQ